MLLAINQIKGFIFIFWVYLLLLEEFFFYLTWPGKLEERYSNHFCLKNGREFVYGGEFVMSLCGLEVV
jgi:hypothetical protein